TALALPKRSEAPLRVEDTTAGQTSPRLASDLLLLEKINESSCAATISRLIFDSSLRHHSDAAEADHGGNASRRRVSARHPIPIDQDPLHLRLSRCVAACREMEVVSCQIPSHSKISWSILIRSIGR